LITGPVAVLIAELEVVVVVVSPTVVVAALVEELTVEVLITLPGGTTTIVTGMHGFVGSKAKRKTELVYWIFGMDLNSGSGHAPGLSGGEYRNS
jgi:hypothetical protein